MLTKLTITLLYLLISVVHCIKSSNYSKDSNGEFRDIHVTALILARGGSKGIPLKNIVKLGNSTLLGRSLSTLNQCNFFEDIWVSTDHEKIAEEAKKCKFFEVIKL